MIDGRQACTRERVVAPSNVTGAGLETQAASYQFTSVLPTRIPKTLAPLLADEVNRVERVGTTCAADAPARISKPTQGAESPRRGRVPAVPSPEALDTVPGLDCELPAVAVRDAEPDAPP